MSNLPQAEIRRKVSKKIAALLAELPAHEQPIVLEDILVDLYERHSKGVFTLGELNKMGPLRYTQVALAGPVSLGDRIVEHCRARPRPDGIYFVRDAVAALLPDDKAGSTKVYSAILRSSPQSDRTKPKHPRFEWLGDGKFKLLSNGAS